MICDAKIQLPEGLRILEHLPVQHGHAADNMAIDQLLLLSRTSSPFPCFRHYNWLRPAYTFGFAQSWGPELDELHNQGMEIVRRETGGGLVDHRNDWTYTLILPAVPESNEWCAIRIYAQIHRCLVNALQQQNINTILEEHKPDPLEKGAFSACFRRTEKYDVVLPSGNKIAGAAQRRSKPGVLFQGYMDRAALPQVDWGRFETAFVNELAHWLECKATHVPMPDWEHDTLTSMRERFASEEWNRHRKRA